MKLDIKCEIEVPGIEDPVIMTPEELNKFHDDLTKFINNNFNALNKFED